jgi:hypothetical protein
VCFRPCLRLAHVRSRHAPADWSAITEQPDANIELAQLRQDRGLSDERVRVAARQRLPAQPIARVVADASRVTGPVSTWARRRARSGTARPLVACSRSSRTDSSPMRYCRVTAPTARPGFPRVCYRGRVRGGQLDERRRPREGLADGVARQVRLVGAVPHRLPHPALRRSRRQHRFRRPLPYPARDASFGCLQASRTRGQELSKIGSAADLVTDKRSPASVPSITVRSADGCPANAAS